MQSIVVKAPGRINLIGEHTDYNHGFVLPAAIQQSAIASLSKRSDDQIHLTAIDIPDEVIIDSIHNLGIHEKQWVNYIVGVVAQFVKKQLIPSGFNIAITSDIPIGAGLSSSAAIECAVAMGINELFSVGLEKMELALMAQKAEHEYAGVNCGIMDQFASLFGKKDQVLLLDCSNMEYQYFPIHLKGYEIVLFDTGVKHALANSEYNTRKKECEQAVQLIQKQYPQVKSLRDASMDMLNDCVDIHKEPVVYKRAQYVIEEIERTKLACDDLKKNDLEAFGQKMFATHEGLSNLYEVSCPELDILVGLVKSRFEKKKDAVLGARMMGGGFGGCTINIIQSSEAPNLIKEITQAYQEATGKSLRNYIVSIENGAGVI